MAVGKPLLMAVDGDAADLVRKSKCGFIAESENPQSIADAAESLANLHSSELQNMGARASHFYQENLGIKVGVNKFSTIFRTLARGGRQNEH
jgi:glycosyltransferase involved in cell wall biosynthesis